MTRLFLFLSQDTCRVGTLATFFASVPDQRVLQEDCLRVLQQLEPEHLWRPLWLLRKSHAVSPLSEKDLLRIAEEVDEPVFWITRLCLCQLFADATCPVAARDLLFPFLLRACEDRRPIIRAWALSSLWTFRDDASYAVSIKQIWKHAQNDPAPSIQARLRRLQPKPKFKPKLTRHR